MKKWTTTQLIALSFLATIFAGALLLMLPCSSADGRMTAPVDALFTATTSVCVTGLVTVSTMSHWSAFGQVVITVLIQLGGLGIMTVSMAVLIFMGKRMNLREQVMVQETYSLDSLAGIRQVVVKIIAGTFAAEAIGAFFYALVYVPQFGLVRGVGASIFNAVSTFCNAGMDIVSEDSLAPYVMNPVINVTTVVLIIVSGIGFLVWWDLVRVFREKKHSGIKNYRLFARLRLHSKLALVTTLILIAGGMLLYLLFEWSNPETLGRFGVGGKLTAALFQSVTTRTAGFYTISQGALRSASVLLTLILMFIGGSPMGTAGGVKTTTIAMLVLTVAAVMKGRRSTEMFGRRLAVDSLRTALCVVMVALGVVFVGSTLLFLTDGFSFEDTLYEIVSAVATVGLSRGITPQLSTLGKLIVIVIMYIGRTGPITVAFLFFTGKKGGAMELPESKIMIG
ncbi:MAG: potassium transporter KtrB [Lachnospiraceae bacterium]|nr:potassium transporter KtrB [Lachnospiraceae bacterium]